MTKLDKLVKVSDRIDVYRYDNGWMVDISGRDKKNDWVSTKTICNTEEEMFNLIKEWNTKEVE